MFDPSFQTIWGGNLTAVFCDTGWEHPDTYKHVNDVCLQMGVRLITLKSKYDFVSLAVHKKRFPSTICLPSYLSEWISSALNTN